MPSNQQRREAAKRKLQRQLVRREVVRARRRRTSLIVGAAAIVVVAAGVVWLVTSAGSGSPVASGDSGESSAADTGAPETSGPSTPCTYTPAGTAAKEVQPPANISPAREGTVNATMSLNGETVDLSLDRALAPCSVNSFLSLASQGFYDGTSCHRLTKSAGLNVLQCGDPSGKGNGGPGYEYAPQVAQDAAYPKGTLAMANTPTGEGSQFFIAYGATTISPSYTVIGTVSEAGMGVVDAIAAQGVTDDRQDGKPVAQADIESLTVPGDAVAASTQWPTSSAPDSGAIDTGALPTDLPTAEPSADPSAEPTAEPSAEPTAEPSAEPSEPAVSSSS